MTPRFVLKGRPGWGAGDFTGGAEDDFGGSGAEGEDAGGAGADEVADDAEIGATATELDTTEAAEVGEAAGSELD